MLLYFIFPPNCTSNGQFATQIALLRLLALLDTQTLAQKEFVSPASQCECGNFAVSVTNACVCMNQLARELVPQARL